MSAVVLLGLLVGAIAEYTVNPAAIGRTFTGIGAISGGGATSRLLVSYPEPQLSELLDLLFLPNYAASLDILKVEIGGDAQSTDGSEASHMHTADDLNYDRGYEWWLMTQAKQRNPNIKLYGLPWAYPSWVGNGTGNPYAFPALTADYIVKWVDGAKTVYNLDIDYVGIWNERSYNITYIETLRTALDAAGYPNTAIVAPDSNWDIASDILANPTLAAAVYAIGAHYPGTESTPQAIETGKPLWASEDMSTYNDLRGAGCWTRVLNQNYVNGNMTTTISWNLISSYYEGLLWFGTAIMTAAQPWSGFYDTTNVGLVWASAHTTQFSDPGWSYLVQGSGSGFLENGGSYVTLTNGSQFSIVIEKMAWAHSQCIRPALNEYTVSSETATFTLSGEWSTVTTLYVWQTVFGWNGMEQVNSSYFQQLAPITVVNGVFSLTINPDELYTITTLNTGNKAEIPASPPSQPFPSVYSDDFESYNVSSEAQYFADQAGTFEIYDSQGPNGKVMRQVVPNVPICWSGDFAPFSVIGDSKWSDTVVSASVLIETTGAAFVAARTGICCYPSGVFLSVSVDSQQWLLSSTVDVENPASILTSGSYSVSANNWYNLSLSVIGSTVNAWVGSDQVVGSFTLQSIESGWAAIGSSRQPNNVFTYAQFDNFQVYGYQLKCPSPFEGNSLSVIWCGEPNSANTEWIVAGGQIKVKSNPTLCVTGPVSYSVNPYPVTLQACQENNPLQQFSFVNSTQYPFSSISQGQASLGTTDDNTVVLIGSTPFTGVSVISACASGSSQDMTFTGSSSSAGQVKTSQGLCLDGACDGGDCYPLSFFVCNSSVPTQSWTLSSSNALINAATGYCLDVFNKQGPLVGAYSCNGQTNQEWNISPTSVASVGLSGQCLTAQTVSASAVQVVLNEFGNGEITLFGADVVDQCIGACSAV